METLFEIGCFILFILEGFLVLTHLHIALSLRALPLKDMARMQNFFLFATLTVATTGQFVTSPIWMLGVFQMAHNLYCYLTWDVSSYSKKVRLILNIFFSYFFNIIYLPITVDHVELAQLDRE